MATGAGRERMSRLIEAMAHDERVDLLKRLDPEVVESLLPLVAKADRFDFPNVAALRAFLEQAAVQKVIDAYRHHTTLKKDVHLQQPLGALVAQGAEPSARTETPSQFLQAEETREQLLAGQPDEVRALIELKAQDYSNQEAAASTGLNLRTVQRLLKALRESWQARRPGGQP